MENSIVSLVNTLLSVYTYMIIAYVLLSWVPNARDSFIGQLLGRFVEPYLSIFRRFIPAIGGVIDVSPIVAIIAMQFISLGVETVIRFIIP
ncbi:YggT family protein [Paenibacillus sp.]|uniref:YggT family protein n=1 Tax=Paenibacillus sp. TaxID=58172 RepID=UPI002D687EC8|nr:YggT family protein [Paenibacillus sp.]HZG88245.1 YggT family protein [Paenibacillus sp.]